MHGFVETEEDALHLQEHHETRERRRLDSVAAKKENTKMTSNIESRVRMNIALINYWGKENKDLFIPMNSSLSF